MKKILFGSIVGCALIVFTGCTSGNDAKMGSTGKCAAGGKCDSGKKCQVGGKCGGDMAKKVGKKCAANAKCGAGKCGGESKMSK